MQTKQTRIVVAALAGLAFPAALAAALPPPSSPKPVKAAPTTPAAFFQTKVRPLLAAQCTPCHSGEAPGGKLDLTNRAALLKGGHSGPAVSVGKPARESLLVRAVGHQGEVKMPPQGKLPQADVATLTRWVEMGLPWSDPKPGDAAHAAPSTHHGPPAPDSPEARNFWAFRPVKRPVPPPVKNKAWVRNPVDAFVLAKLERNGLAPAPPAGRTALLRRVTYDLTGLPPTPAEVQAFLADTSPNAYEKIVDRLLAAPSTASVGGVTGSIWCATPKPTRSSGRRQTVSCGAIATT
jgi:hypothetical protein